MNKSYLNSESKAAVSLKPSKAIRLLLMVLFFCTFGNVASAANRFSVATGNWNSTATWSDTSNGSAGASVPVAGDVVIIEGQFTVHVTSNVNCSSLQVGGPGNSDYGAIDFTGAFSITVSGNSTFGGYGHTARTGTITFSSGSSLNSSSLTLGNANGTPAAGIINMTNGGTINVGSLSVNTVTGNTWTPGSGTVVMTATNTLPNTIFTSFNNLTISAGTTTFGAIKSITNNFSIATGAIANLGTFTHTAGTLTLGGVAQAPESWGSTSSIADNKNDTFFTATTGMVNNSCTAPTITAQPTALTICENTGGSFSVATSTGGSTYQWQYSLNDSTWINTNGLVGFSGHTAATLILTNISAAYNGYFVRCILRSSTGCRINSNSVVLTVNSQTVAGTVTGGTAICSGSNSGILTLSGHTGTIIKWQSSVSPFSTWTDIANNTTTYTSGALTATTQFRAVVQSGSCATTNSAVTTVTVSPLLSNNNLTYTNGTSLQVSVTANEDSNAVLNSATGSYFATVNFASYGTPTGTSPNFVITSCHSATSLSVAEGYLLGNSTATIPATNTIFGDPCYGTGKRLSVIATYVEPICGGNSITISGSLPTGGTGAYTYLWESSTTSATAGYAAAAGTNNGTNYTSGAITQNTWFRRTVTSGGCSSTSANVLIKVNPTPSTPTIGTTTQPTCSTATGSVVLNGLPSGSWELTRTPGSVTTTGTGTSTTISGLATGTYTYSVNSLNNGLKGEYFNNKTLSGSPVLTRTDATVGFDWGNGSPDPSINNDGFSVKWSGLIQPLYSETYTFSTSSDDGIRLLVNGVQIIYDWNVHAPTPNTGTIALTAGVKYDIVLEYFENTNGAVSQLSWSSPTNPTSVIVPTTQLYSVASCSSPASANVVINAQPATPAVPTGTAAQTFCSGATVANLSATGTGIQWYAAASGGSALATTTALVNTTHYYATQTVGGCESTTRFDVTATVNATPSAPTIGTTTQPTCTTATGSVVISGLPTGSWELTRTPGSVTTTGTGTSTTISGLATGTYTYSVNSLNNGLKGEYFNNIALSGSPVLTRTDATINFSWADGSSPDASINKDNFSVRWSGLIQPLYTESYTFTTSSDDGIRLWVNGVQVINNWSNHAPTTNTGTIALTAGVKYNIVLEYYDNWGGAVSQLSWSSPTNPTSVIVPTTQLFPVGSCSSPASATVVINPAVTNTWTTSWSNDTPTSSQKLVFSGDYPPAVDPNVDITGCSCMVTGGAAVTIKSGKTLTITNDVTVVGGGTLTFENNASLVQINDAAVNSGNITYKRTTTSVLTTDYTYWSSPVASQNLNLSPFYTSGMFYSYDDFAIPEDWKEETAATIMQIGKGYIVRGPQISSPPPPPGFYNATFVGVPNNGIKTIAIGSTGTSNLLGNPYPSALDAVAFLAANSTLVEGTIYFWTHNTAIQDASNITGVDEFGNPKAGSGTYAYTSDDYASYNTTGGVGTGNFVNGVEEIANKPTGKIAAGQAFFTTSLGAGTVTFNNSMRVSGNNTQFFKTKDLKAKTVKAIEKNRIWLNLSNDQGAFKQTLVGYITDATNDYDSRFDGETFDGNEFVDFYSINQDKNLVIQGRALPFDENDEVPLGFKSTIDGAFTINIDQTDGLLTNQGVFIEDKLTNTVFDLKSGNYTFNTVAGTFNDRFVLRYTNKTLAVNDFDVQTNTVLVSNKNKQIKINSFSETIDKVTIYDLLGKQIYQKDKVNGNEFLISDLVSSHQTLLVKTSLQNGTTVTDKIIY